MKKWIMLILKGFIIGIGKIMPGVSGGVLAISLGVYERGIEAIGHFWKFPKQNTLFLGCLLLGGMLAIALGSDVISYSLQYYYLPTMLLFIGLMLGGLPSLRSSLQGSIRHNLGMVMIPIVLIFLLYFLHPGIKVTSSMLSFIIFFCLGFIDAVTMIIPGVSGTALFMLLGCYPTILHMLSSMKSVSGIIENFHLLFPFGFGIGIGIIIVSKAMSYLFFHYKGKIYYLILTFAIVSIGVLFFQTLSYNYTFFQVLIGFVFLLIGFMVSFIMENKK